MKKMVIVLIIITNLAFSDGSVCPSCDEFEKLSKVEQDKIIKKDFKILHKLFDELNGIVDNIDKTRVEIKKIRKDLKNNDGTCDALDLIKLDLDAFESQLSKIRNKDGMEYQKIYKEYSKHKKVYDEEKSDILCR